MPFASINNRRIHYTDTTPSPSSSTTTSPPKPTILLIHGLGSTQNFYHPILPTLTAANHRVITFDNYGAGRSIYLPDLFPETSIQVIADDAWGLLDHLGVEKAIVGGYSMGGMVPSLMAGMDADSGRGRMVAGVCIGPVHPSESVAEVFRGRVKTVEGGGIETMANTIPFSAPHPRTTPLARSFIREMILSQSPEGYIANCRAIEHATPPDYSKVKCPMYVIAGDSDKSAPVSGCEFIFGRWTGLLEGEEGRKEGREKKMDVLREMGHWYCVEGPEEVGGLVRGWCAQFEG